MRRLDKMTRMLLGLIALFLGIIALKPILKITPEANAQTSAASTGSSGTTTSGSSGTTVASLPAVTGVKLLTRIVVRDPVLGVQTMDRNGVFFVWTRNTVEVYRVE